MRAVNVQGGEMSVRKCVSIIKRQEGVKVVVLFRKNTLEDYKRELYNLNDVSINDSENVEIICNDKVMEIPIKEINKVECKLNYIVFYEDLRITLFDFINK